MLTTVHDSAIIIVQSISCSTDLGWSKDPGPPNGGEFPRRFSFQKHVVVMQERILSIFIDESGDFGPYEQHSPYYQVAMVLHDQSIDIYDAVEPVQYKLFQDADLICTMELLKEKAETKSFTKSETEFFYSIRDFKKNYLKAILNKHL